MITRSNKNSFPELALLTAVCLISACAGKQAETVAPETVALVQAVPVQTRTLIETVEAYGTVVAAPGALQTPSAPFDAIVERVLVSPGMAVRRGQKLMNLKPSPSALTAIRQPASALRATNDLLRTAQERDSLGLGTRDDVSQAAQAQRDAQARDDEVAQWAGTSAVTAPAAGVVTAVLVSEGSLLPQGAPLVDLTLEGRFEVRLGVEPEDVARIKIGQPVRLFRGDETAGTTASGTVRSTSRAVNPDTRLVDVMIALSDSEQLLFGETVRGQIGVESVDGLIVPRSAVLPHQGIYELFVVKNGLASARSVRVGVQTDSLVEVLDGITVGDSVVILGNYVLQDSMRVRTNSNTSSTGTNQ